MPARLARAAAPLLLTTAVAGCPIPDLVEPNDGGASSGGSGGEPTCGAEAPACGVSASAVTYYSTLDDAAAIETPAIGAAGSKAEAVAFTSGPCGNALDVSANTINIRVEEAGHIDYARGAIWFWFRPNTASNVHRNLLGTVGYSNAGGLRVAMAGSALTVSMKGAPPGQSELVAQFELPGSATDGWAHYAVTWDTAAAGTSAHLYVNGCDAEAIVSPVVQLTPRMLSDDRVIVGAQGISDPNFADGAFDELQIHGVPAVPASQ
jgi:hypothetical protein